MTTLLVGLSNPATADRLVRLSSALAAASRSEVLLTHVVTVANQISLATGSSSPEVIQARDLLEAASEAARKAGADPRALVEVARSVEEGLLAAASSRHASMILVGYSGDTTDEDTEERFDRTMHRVARKARADVIVAKFRRESHRRMLIPLAEEAPMRLTALLCRAVMAESGAAATFLHVRSPGSPGEDLEARLRERLAAAGLAGHDLRIVESDDPASVIVHEAEGYDLLVLGPSGRPGLLDAVFSSRARTIAESVTATVILGWSLANEGA